MVDLLTNTADFTPEQIAAEIYERLPMDRARRWIDFTKKLNASSPA